MSGTLILQCSCTHKGQDDLHGSKNRVFNKKTKSSNQMTSTYTCSVCGTTKQLSVKGG
jgi:ribosomal protein L44E